VPLCKPPKAKTYRFEIWKVIENKKRPIGHWQKWLEHPEKLFIRHIFFQVHLWLGAVATAYILLMSTSGSAIVFRNELAGNPVVEWLVRFHETLLIGTTGRFVNGVGGGSLTLLCLTGAVIWWPGIKHWRRSLAIDWGGHVARISWDAHSALGFWFFLFVLLWGISGMYFAFPEAFNFLLAFDPDDRFTNSALGWLSDLHFGRFGWFIQTIWVLLGLVPAILAFTGVFICCRRVVFNEPSNPKKQSE
jgi:uncharacterized iron-regulated membrane protein